MKDKQENKKKKGKKRWKKILIIKINKIKERREPNN